ncbi:MAG: FecR domain-containing protein, partial [Bacteroidota bacterium]|nr:FecR domain-containing protein [Bacteroidota bacterium]
NIQIMKPDHFQQLLDKFIRGVCTPEEERLIAEWYEKIGEEEISAANEPENDPTREKIWSVINPGQKSGSRKWMRVLIRAAAITIPLLTAAVLYYHRQGLGALIEPVSHLASADESLHFRNEGSVMRPIALPDGSVIQLQPSSEIELHKDFGEISRELDLRGEAFFDVAPDASKPFLVYANEVVTRVIGTSFNIKAYEREEEVTVAVRTGKVSVYANMNKTSRNFAHSPTVILTPNQQIVYHRLSEMISKKLVEEPEIVLPNSDLFKMQFENAEVSEILDVLQENYGVIFNYDRDKLSNCRLTTSMSEEGLYERIEVICKAIGASYSIDDDAVITITSNGC